MSYTSLDAAKLTQGKPLDTDLMMQIKDNFDALNGSFTTLATSGIPNGSFEVDSDANGEPDSWTLSTADTPGGTVARDTTTVAHGQASLKMVHPGGTGNGGGTATSDYVECNELEKLALKFIHWATAAGMKNQVILYWYDKGRVALVGTPSTTIYDSTANPTSATTFIKEALPPATARYFKVKLVGGESSVDVAGTAYFDGLTLTMTTDQVLFATSGAAVDAVGTYAFLFNSAATVRGSNYAGSGLKFAAATTTTQVVTLASPTPSGTWKAMGSSDGTTNNATTFLRVA